MFFGNLVLLVLLSLTAGEDVPKSDRSDFKKSLSRDCANSYTPTCFKLDVVSWVDKLNEEDSYNFYPGVSLVRDESSARANTADIVTELAREFPDDPNARLDAFLMKKITGYLTSHSIRLNLWDNNYVGTARRGGGGGGGGGGKGGGGGMGAIIAAGAMMKGTMFALALGGIAALAGKALMTGLISLLLSAIIGLKSLSSGGKSTTYEVIAKPIYTHSNSHSASHEEHGGHYGGHSSYGRSFDMPLPLGLQEDYKPTQKL